MKLVRLGHPNYRTNENLVNDLFDSFLYNDYHASHCKSEVAANILETNNGFNLELLVPGFSKEDLHLNFHKNTLTVKVAKNEESKENSTELKYVRKDFEPVAFEKQFQVPETVNAEKIEAKFENGILKIVLPKKEEALEKAPIDIKIS